MLSVGSAAASLALAIKPHQMHVAQIVFGAFALLLVLLGLLKLVTDVSFTVHENGALKSL